ncbi:MAG: hypothetical protein N2654_03235, partial [Deltaproteobacteria bacterium]|nr:hypothetical protein [Deltaproteobacteria bacterium]
ADLYSEKAFKEKIRTLKPENIIIPFGKYKGNSINKYYSKKDIGKSSRKVRRAEHPDPILLEFEKKISRTEKMLSET